MATTSITVAETAITSGMLAIADDALILGHRISQWTGHAPTLEFDLAMANIALDMLGQARALYKVLEPEVGFNEDELAYLRDPEQFRNALIMELPNGDFGSTILRIFVVSVYMKILWGSLRASPHPELSGIAHRSERESAYHVQFASEWVVRLGDGTEESHGRMQQAAASLWPYTGELFEPQVWTALLNGMDGQEEQRRWAEIVGRVLAKARLTETTRAWMMSGGRQRRHTEHLGHLLAEMQILPRSYPGANW